MGKSVATTGGESSATGETGGDLEGGLFVEERWSRGICRGEVWRSGPGLAEEIQVELIVGTGKGDVERCVPSLVPVAEEGRSRFFPLQLRCAHRVVILQRIDKNCSCSLPCYYWPGPAAEVRRGPAEQSRPLRLWGPPLPSLPAGPHNGWSIYRDATRPPLRDEFITIWHSCDCRLAARLMFCSTEVAFMSTLNYSANEPVNPH